MPLGRAAAPTLGAGLSLSVSGGRVPYLHTSSVAHSRIDRALAEGSVNFSWCSAGQDGGAIFAGASITFGAHGRLGRTAISSNAAGGNGGGVMAFSSAAELLVASGHIVALEDNTASVDGGGLAFAQGASVSLALEGCDPSTCSPSAIGNGVCDAPCLRRACNW